MGLSDWTLATSDVVLAVTWTAPGQSPQALTRANLEAHSGDAAVSSLWYLVGSNIGTNGVITVSRNFNDKIVGIATNWVGVNQTSPLRSSNLAGGSNLNPSLSVTSSSGDLVIDNIAKLCSDTVTPSQTLITIAKACNPYGLDSYKQATSTSTTMSWAVSGDSRYAQVGASFRPAP